MKGQSLYRHQDMVFSTSPVGQWKCLCSLNWPTCLPQLPVSKHNTTPSLPSKPVLNTLVYPSSRCACFTENVKGWPNFSLSNRHMLSPFKEALGRPGKTSHSTLTTLIAFAPPFPCLSVPINFMTAISHHHHWVYFFPSSTSSRPTLSVA